MKERESPIGIFVHAHLGLDVVAAMPIGGDLQQLVLVHDAVVGAPHALFLWPESYR